MQSRLRVTIIEIMPAYIIGRVDITELNRYREYMAHSPRVVAQFGGRFAVRSSDVVTLEGPAENRRLIVLEFPTIEQARTFYDSAEYRAIVPFREGAGDAQIVLVDGYPDHEWESVRAKSEKLGPP